MDKIEVDSEREGHAVLLAYLRLLIHHWKWAVSSSLVAVFISIMVSAGVELGVKLVVLMTMGGTFVAGIYAWKDERSEKIEALHTIAKLKNEYIYALRFNNATPEFRFTRDASGLIVSGEARFKLSFKNNIASAILYTMTHLSVDGVPYSEFTSSSDGLSPGAEAFFYTPLTDCRIAGILPPILTNLISFTVEYGPPDEPALRKLIRNLEVECLTQSFQTMSLNLAGSTDIPIISHC